MGIQVQPRIQNVDETGAPYAFALANFWLTGTTTPTTIWQDAALTITQTNPVVADDKGLFPAIYIDDNVVYRLQITNADVSVIIQDTDPVNALLTVGAAQLEDGAIEAKLGYTPVDPDNAVFTSVARFTPTLPPAILHPDDMGYLGAPETIIDTSLTLTLAHSGQMLTHDDTSDWVLTIPLNSVVAWPIGHKFYLNVTNTGTTQLFRGDPSIQLRVAGSPADGDLTYGQYTLVEVRKVDTDSWVVSGVPPSVLNVQNGSRSITLQDNGVTLQHNDSSNYNYTLDPVVTTPYPAGFSFTAVGIGSGNTVIVRGAGVALRKAGSSTNADITIAQWGKWTIQHMGSDSWIATGAG